MNLGMEWHFHGFQVLCCDWRGLFDEGGISRRGEGRLGRAAGLVPFLMLLLVFGFRRLPGEEV